MKFTKRTTLIIKLNASRWWQISESFRNEARDCLYEWFTESLIHLISLKNVYSLKGSYDAFLKIIILCIWAWQSLNFEYLYVLRL